MNITQFDFVNRIVENRVVLEKLRPLEKKLQYQIDKILQMTDDVITADDPLNLKPNLDNLEDDEEVHDTIYLLLLFRSNKKILSFRAGLR